MAGFLFALDSLDSLEFYASNGVYGTKVTRPGRFWSAAQLATLGDYAAMRPGDLVFFFIARKIYGIGKLVGVGEQPSPAVCNYPESYLPTAEPGVDLLLDQGDQLDRPWICLFEPSPAFFRRGFDMDDVLDADVKGVATSLRVFERVSFIQMEPDEVDVLTDIFVRNLDANAERFEDLHARFHDGVRSRNLGDRRIDTTRLLNFYRTPDGSARSERALETWMIDLINSGSPQVAILGRFDYVTHQLPASPQKPVMYMDRIDVFGWEAQTSPGPKGSTATAFKVIEVKKDAVAGTSGIDTVNQLMKYVDWLAPRRGGYGLIHAFLVARGFSDDVVQYVRAAAIRDYVSQRRPYLAHRWHQISLVSYDLRETHPLQLVYPTAD